MQDALRSVFSGFANATKDKKFHVHRKQFQQIFRIPGQMGERLFDLFDTDGNGKIDFKEWIRGLFQLLNATPQEKIDLVFNLADHNKNLLLAKSEFKTILTTIATGANLPLSYLLTGRKPDPNGPPGPDDAKLIDLSFRQAHVGTGMSAYARQRFAMCIDCAYAYALCSLSVGWQLIATPIMSCLNESEPLFCVPCFSMIMCVVTGECCCAAFRLHVLD